MNTINALSLNANNLYNICVLVHHACFLNKHFDDLQNLLTCTKNNFDIIAIVKCPNTYTASFITHLQILQIPN